MNEIQEINRRNTITVEEALRGMRAEILSQQIRIDGLNNSISNMNERINFLEKLVFEYKIKTVGRGPSVK